MRYQHCPSFADEETEIQSLATCSNAHSHQGADWGSDPGQSGPQAYALCL